MVFLRNVPGVQLINRRLTACATGVGGRGGGYKKITLPPSHYFLMSIQKLG